MAQIVSCRYKFFAIPNLHVFPNESLDRQAKIVLCERNLKRLLDGFRHHVIERISLNRLATRYSNKIRNLCWRHGFRR